MDHLRPKAAAVTAGVLAREDEPVRVARYDLPELVLRPPKRSINPAA